MPGTNVLIADDDPFLREILEHKLRTAGYVVRMAEDGRRALVSCRSVRPDLVVLDAMMPIIDGFEVLRRLKADPETSAIPVVMLTALRREEDIVGALKLGAADYIVKPFIPDELLARIGRLLPMRTDHADPSRSGHARLLRMG
jgi:DNA-binding response OmpR family regulator